MKNQWPIWMFIFGVIVIVLYTFISQGNNSSIALSEVMSKDAIDNMPDIEYEFVSDSPAQPVVKEEATIKPLALTVPEKEPAPINIVKNNSPTIPATTSTASVNTLSNVPFTIQVGSYKEKNRAEMALKGMKAAGYPAYIARKDLGSKGVWYRIYVGSFDTKVQAGEYLSQISSKYKNSFIISPSK